MTKDDDDDDDDDDDNYDNDDDNDNDDDDDDDAVLPHLVHFLRPTDLIRQLQRDDYLTNNGRVSVTCLPSCCKKTSNKKSQR